MIQSLFSAANAMISQQTNIDTIANNVANVNTNGYKKIRLDFKDCIYERMNNPVDNSAAMNLQRGAGSIVLQTLRVFEQGVHKSTENPYDLALEGRGFFVLRAPDGSLAFSRNGQFRLSVENDGTYLVDENSYYVLDQNGQRIRMQQEPSRFTVSAEGQLFFDDGTSQNTTAGPTLALVDFSNSPGLMSVGRFYYVPTENSGQMTRVPADTQVKQQVVENSNVDYAEELTRLIRAQRAFQLAARAIVTADQMAQTANTIRG